MSRFYVIVCFCCYVFFFFFFKQKTAYEMRISDWSSDVCSSDLRLPADHATDTPPDDPPAPAVPSQGAPDGTPVAQKPATGPVAGRRRPGGAGVAGDRKSVVEGKRVSVRVDLGGRRVIKKKTN